MANRLADETSPYLLQHKDNPVHWQPWGEQALAEARERDVPLLVSIGYAACHWCHVMEHESFEDPEIAKLMNDHFVCVKVDREERPDVDAIYIDAVQAMIGQAGWPLNVFITPGQVPFFGGTYYPPQARLGNPSWRQVIDSVVDAWATRRTEIVAQSDRIVDHLQVSERLNAADDPIEPGLLAQAVERLRESYDEEHGGFGPAPKFPPALVIELLLRRGETEMALTTLRAMARGGICDQLGGGFSRYAVDEAWAIPHFEKMLYDNALLARAYLHGWQVGGDEELLRVSCETLDWMLRDLRGPEGGFASSFDADSEGVEGRYYVWTFAEMRETIGDDDLMRVALAYYGATMVGNFDHANVLRLTGAELEEEAEDVLPEIRRRLLAARELRVQPALDDKRLTAWNALAISALAEAGAVLQRQDYLDAAIACAEFVLRELRDADGRLLRSWSAGRAKLPGYLDDHASMLEALLTLYEATFDPRWFHEARALAEILIARFLDEDRGGFFQTPDDHERLIARRKDIDDAPTPSGNASAAFGLLRLARLTGEARYERHALHVIQILYPTAVQHPTSFAHLLEALDFALAPVREVAIVGPGSEPLVRTVRAAFRPNVVLAGGTADGVPLLEGRTPVDGRAAAYVCERSTCQQPVTEPEELAALLAPRGGGSEDG
jgi:uncharacterized protein YyaL (SSP411 family)